MNMDEVYQQLRIFEQSLNHFADALNLAWHDIETHHNQLDPRWQDEYQRRYMALWEPLSEQLNAYRTRDLPMHLDLLKRKISLAEEYLQGPV